MRSTLLLSVFALLNCTSIATWASGPGEVLLCEACRDPYDHPKDFGNYVFNQTTGDAATLTLAEANQILVCNPDGQWAMVDLDFVLETTGILFNFGWFGLNLSVPNSDIRISVQDPDGVMTSYDVFSSSPKLSVGGEIVPLSEEVEPQVEDEPSTSLGGGEYISDPYSFYTIGGDGVVFWYPYGSPTSSEIPNDLR